MKASKEGLVLYHGKIYTQDRKNPLVSALVTRGNRIIAAGRDSLKDFYPSSKFVKINLKGRTVLPGFCDCHTHFLSYVQTLDRLNLEKARSLSQALDLVRTFTAGKKPGGWISGYNWDASTWKDGTFLDKKILDQVSALHPIALSARDGHQLWVNSLALKLAGIDENTPEPSDGVIVRYARTNEPTGILKERAPWKLFDLIPKSCSKSAVSKAYRSLHSAGITGIHNMENGESLSFFEKEESSDRLPLRVWQTIARDGLDNAIKLGLHTGFGSDKLKIGGLKLFADGALGSRTALMFKPYEDEPGNCGVETLSQIELNQLAKRASGAGISLVIHAIGDRANHQALLAIGEASSANLRHRIEHAQILQPADLDLFRKMKVIASFQPVHCPNDFPNAVKFWGSRNKLAYPISSLLKRKTRICFGSDLPLYDFGPLLGVYSAVNRRLPSNNNPTWNEAEKINVKDAISAYTLGAAYAAGWERKLGSIAPGKLADLVILSGDPHQTQPEQLHKVKVTGTVFDGKLVWGEWY